MQIDDGPIIKLESPVAWITYPGPRFRVGNTRKSWYHNYISFKGPQVEEYLKNELLTFDPITPVIPISDSVRFHDAFKELIKYNHNPIHGHTRSVQMLEGILLQLHEQKMYTSAETPTERKVIDLIDHICTQPEAQYNIELLAKN